MRHEHEAHSDVQDVQYETSLLPARPAAWPWKRASQMTGLAGQRREQPYLERLKDNLYIAPDDPLYWHKKLRYQGSDFETLFQMAELREQEGKLEQARALYQRAEQAAKGENQFVRAVYRRQQVERRLAGSFVPEGSGYGSEPKGNQRNAGTAMTAGTLLPAAMGVHSAFANAARGSSGGGALSISRPGPVYTLHRAGGPVRWWMGLTGLLLGLVLGLLAAMGLVQYRLDVHVYHHAEAKAHMDRPADEAVDVTVGPGRWVSLFGSGEIFGSSESGSLAKDPDAGQAQGEPALTYLRTAVLGYYRLNGTFPDRLEALAGPFPDNYISGIPPDPVFGQRKVVDEWDGTGGWVYEKPPDSLGGGAVPLRGEGPAVDVDEPVLLQTVAESVRPNWPVAEPTGTLWDRLVRMWRAGTPAGDDGEVSAFQPLQVLVLPDARKVLLVSGHRMLLATTAAVGLPQTPTPTGNFFVRKRVWLPVGGPSRPLPQEVAQGFFEGEGKENRSAFPLSGDAATVYSAAKVHWPYGVAGLEFADGYAIHGTDESHALGQAVTGGCLRVDNAVMRQLFAWTPLGTEVIIRDGDARSWPEQEIRSWTVQEIYDGGSNDADASVGHLSLVTLQPRADEHDGTGVYAWKG